MANKSLGWRWTEYFTGILQLFVLVVDLIFLDESYPPVLLVHKARRLRHETGNWALHAKHEEWDVSVRELARKFLVRPFQLLGTPICFLVALYASFCYGILYMQLGGIPIIFGEERGWPAVSTELPFLSILIGAILGCGANVYNQKVLLESIDSKRSRLTLVIRNRYITNISIWQETGQCPRRGYHQCVSDQCSLQAGSSLLAGQQLQGSPGLLQCWG